MLLHIFLNRNIIAATTSDYKWVLFWKNDMFFTHGRNTGGQYTGGSEQVKQVKQLLHRKSEAESAKNLANWQIYPLFLLAASPEITLFLPP